MLPPCAAVQATFTPSTGSPSRVMRTRTGLPRAAQTGPVWPSPCFVAGFSMTRGGSEGPWSSPLHATPSQTSDPVTSVPIPRQRMRCLRQSSGSGCSLSPIGRPAGARMDAALRSGWLAIILTLPLRAPGTPGAPLYAHLSHQTVNFVDPNVFETANAGFAQAMYEEFLRDPAAVGPEWRRLFESGVVGEGPSGNGAGQHMETGQRELGRASRRERVAVAVGEAARKYKW